MPSWLFAICLLFPWRQTPVLLIFLWSSTNKPTDQKTPRYQTNPVQAYRPVHCKTLPLDQSSTSLQTSPLQDTATGPVQYKLTDQSTARHCHWTNPVQAYRPVHCKTLPLDQSSTSLQTSPLQDTATGPIQYKLTDQSTARHCHWTNPVQAYRPVHCKTLPLDQSSTSLQSSPLQDTATGPVQYKLTDQSTARQCHCTSPV